MVQPLEGQRFVRSLVAHKDETTDEAIGRDITQIIVLRAEGGRLRGKREERDWRERVPYRCY
jgi:hypothetical protein